MIKESWEVHCAQDSSFVAHTHNTQDYNLLMDSDCYLKTLETEKICAFKFVYKTLQEHPEYITEILDQGFCALQLNLSPVIYLIIWIDAKSSIVQDAYGEPGNDNLNLAISPNNTDRDVIKDTLLAESGDILE